ncbi:MAG TPA: right-handed parallel beta-helix repeat-containing protein [Pyrinomonadaceae bacterium]|nr:right-handed parallel beta-helix repeat-containing protein [Pyrinomonadaceae bacterium]
MSKFVRLFVILCFTLALCAIANAQATRTWVSGVGDDVNPCSRTAPCKTWAGAISKTFINGEIDALDPGGYGTLVITKSITVDGGTGSGWGSTLASGTNGFTINIAVNANDPLRTAILKHLSINGAGASGTVGTRTGVNGVNYVQGIATIIEDCQIFNFGTNGILVNLTTTGNLSVTRTTVDNNQVGIRQTTTTGTLNVSIADSTIQNSTSNGIQVDAGTCNVANSTIDHNGGAGAVAQGAIGSVLNVDNCSVTDNTGAGIQAGTAVATVRASNNSVHRNGTGMSQSAGIFETCKDNKVRGNITETSGTFTDIAALGACSQ